jgi:hypothetical protein
MRAGLSLLLFPLFVACTLDFKDSGSSQGSSVSQFPSDEELLAGSEGTSGGAAGGTSSGASGGERERLPATIASELLIRNVAAFQSADGDAFGGSAVAPSYTFAKRFSGLRAGAMAEFFQGFEASSAYATATSSEATVKTKPRPTSHKLFTDWRAEAGCYGCETGELPENSAPFRLVAIVNRVDLASEPCSGTGGELRLVYNAFDTSGSFDTPLPFSIIFEYTVPFTAGSWAKRFHALADHANHSAEYRRVLQGLVDAVTSDIRNLHAVRVNEKVLGSSWNMREFRVRGSSLVPVALAETPSLSVNRTAQMDALIDERARQASGTPNAIAESLLTGDVDIPSQSFRWEGTKGQTKAGAFSQRTCNGCHGGNRPANDPLAFEHIGFGSAYYGSSSSVQISDYLEKNELPRRKGIYEANIAVDCSAKPPSGGYVMPSALRFGH